MSKKIDINELNAVPFIPLTDNTDAITAGATNKFITAIDLTKLSLIEDNATADQTAAEVVFTPVGNIAALSVSLALAELDTEKLAKSGDTATGFITLHADPSSSLHAATKQYVDNATAAAVAGVDPKEDCVLASVNDANWGATAVADFVTGTGVLTISNLAAGASRGLLDTGEATDGARVLLMNMADISALTTDSGAEGTPGKYNGIWSVTGGSATSLTLARASDSDGNPAGEVTTGLRTYVASGVTNAGFAFVLNTVGTIVINTTDLTFGRWGKDPLATATESGLLAASDKVKLDAIEALADVTDTANVNAAGALMESDFVGTHSIMATTGTGGTPQEVTIAAGTLLGRTAAGALAGLGAATIRSMINVAANADVTDAASVTSAGAVMHTDLALNSIAAKTGAGDATGIAISPIELIGRGAAGDVAAISDSTLRTDFKLGIQPVYHKITGGEVSQGFFDLAITPVDPGKVMMVADQGGEQSNQAQVGATGASSEFAMGDVNKGRVYFKNASQANGDAAISGLSELLVIDDIVILNYQA